MKTIKNKPPPLSAPASKKFYLKISKIFTLIILPILLICNTLNSLAQNPKDSADRRFYDDFLNHLVGKWRITSTAHGSSFTADLDAKWVLNHQYLLIHLKSHEVIPWWHVEMEYYEYIGYNHYKQRYTVYGMSIEGE